jgi:hypothetical protein
MPLSQQVIDEFKYESLFSEYLPESFNFDKSKTFDIFQIKLPKIFDQIHPHKFTMSNFTKIGKRRQIFIPEIISYIEVINHMLSNNIFDEIITISQNSNHSLSKNTFSSGGIDQLIKHDLNYGTTVNSNPINKSQFLLNHSLKMKRSIGSIAILYLDIANFYKNIYTHYLACIKIGLNQSLTQYYFQIQGLTTSVDYQKYSKLDSLIIKQNKSETIGILTGPRLSNYIAEAYLCKIDETLDFNLRANPQLSSIDFVRYVDDYEFFVKDKNDVEKVIQIVESTLFEYRLTLNDSKTNLIDFPYYINNNLEKLANDTLSKTKINLSDTLELFDKFFILEKSGVKGAIRYLTNSIDDVKIFDDLDLLITYMINILINDDRSLIKICQKFISKKTDFNFKAEHYKLVLDYLIKKLENNNDLEVIWLVYLICILDSSKLDDSIIDNLIDNANELVLIILLNEKNLTVAKKDKIKQSSKSWILCYQLFLKGEIDETTFISKLELNKSVQFYKNMKLNNISFYNK